MILDISAPTLHPTYPSTVYKVKQGCTVLSVQLCRCQSLSMRVDEYTSLPQVPVTISVSTFGDSPLPIHSFLKWLGHRIYADITGRSPLLSSFPFLLCLFLPLFCFRIITIFFIRPQQNRLLSLIISLLPWVFPISVLFHFTLLPFWVLGCR